MRTLAPRDAESTETGDVRVAEVRWSRIGGTWLALIAGVLAIAIVMVVADFGHAPAASADTPPPLVATPIDDGREQVFDRLVDAARQQPDVARYPAVDMVVEYEQWSTLIDADEEAAVLPLSVTRTRRLDGTSSLRTVAADNRWGGVLPVDARRPGEVVDDLASTAEESDAAYGPAPETDATALSDRLLERAVDGTTGDLFQGLERLRSRWTLGGSDTAAALEAIRDRDDAVVVGTVRDRLDRTGVAIRTDSRGGGHFRDILVFDAATGALLSSESQYLGGLEEVGVRPDTVIGYTAWRTS
ncbi:hypothetical protein [Homoserinibacter sp. YIM 151385]|uniref:hypothetical protein n=1 Tax=Homoserinibacter sp. YIM 151385 TaxID=2985506 RepID=UPI0022F0E8EE|nr:hypothetical protein [Homoserinibacter sp. YIM 151385]WBU37890.1 hypothetical protein OF852_13385 [Homoserinibacter sp. YIM 151385]